MPRAGRNRLSVILAAGAIAVIGLVITTVVLSAIRQREAAGRMRDLGGVVTYDFELPPGWRHARSLRDLGSRLEGITDRRDLPDLDPDGRAWLRRLIGPDLLHDVVCVNLAYSYGADGTGRQEPDGAYREALALLADFRELRQLLLHDGQACDLTLEHVGGLKRLEDLYLWNAKVTDRGMENLRFLKRLRYLHLSRAGVGDAGLACLAHLDQLEVLALQGNAFTDAGLVYLQGLTKLRELWLCAVNGGSTRISGSSLEHLAGLGELELLALQDTGFSDAGVEHLAPFRKLKSLYLGTTALTDAGERRLREVVPAGCGVHITPR